MDGAPLIDWPSRRLDYKQCLVPMEQVMAVQNVVGVDCTLHFLLSTHLDHGRQGLLLEQICPQQQISLATKLLAASRRNFQSLAAAQVMARCGARLLHVASSSSGTMTKSVVAC